MQAGAGQCQRPESRRQEFKRTHLFPIWLRISASNVLPNAAEAGRLAPFGATLQVQRGLEEAALTDHFSAIVVCRLPVAAASL